MIRSLFRGAGKFALLLAIMAFLVLVSLFVFGSFILTWPIHRRTPRDQRIKASMDLAQAGMQWVTVFSEGSLRKQMEAALNAPDPDAEDGAEYPYEEGDALILGPGVFVASDGSVLNWRGLNFIPQDLVAAAAKVEDASSDSEM